MLHLSAVEVHLTLRKLSNKTFGHDSFPSFLLRNFEQMFVKPLPIIFSAILQHLVFSDMWKQAEPCPILKFEMADNMENYRTSSNSRC